MAGIWGNSPTGKKIQHYEEKIEPTINIDYVRSSGAPYSFQNKLKIARPGTGDGRSSSRWGCGWGVATTRIVEHPAEVCTILTMANSIVTP